MKKRIIRKDTNDQESAIPTPRTLEVNMVNTMTFFLPQKSDNMPKITPPTITPTKYTVDEMGTQCALPQINSN